jgi:Ni/Fe-hydrogenase subunit HybB-like protein
MEATRKRAAVKDVLWVIATVGLVAALARFSLGLGATTALNDATPWGFWIGFDVMGGVALAAGGFVIAAAVYIFHLEKYRPLVRPAILTAFLGYLAVVVGLLCDLGLPWHIWKPIFHWQHHSVMFEVAWCVMLYTSVLTLEFSPTILQHRWFQAPAFRWVAGWLKRLTLPLVIAGIVLSTLHQSSLGSLMLIAPFRLHPLWYSPILPVLFFVSAVALGLMMVTLEGFISVYLYGHKPRLDLSAGLGRAAAWVLWLYLGLRLGDLALRGVLPAALDGSWQSIYFLLEIGFSALLPALLLSIPSLRSRQPVSKTCALLTVAGAILYRLSVSVVAVYRPPGVTYLPTWMELAVSAGIVSAAGLVFIFLTENLNVFGEAYPPVSRSPYARPVFDPVTRLHRSNSWREIGARRSMIVVFAAALAFAFLPGGARVRSAPHTSVRAALGWEELAVNGDRDSDMVVFDHLAHQEPSRPVAIGDPVICQTCQNVTVSAQVGAGNCTECHHLNKPGDQATPCWECHQDMFSPTSIFDHAWHQVVLGGNAACADCHAGEHVPDTAKACQECHEAMKPAGGETTFNYMAPAYTDAMHGTCIPCHHQEAKARAMPELAHCPACHQQQGDAIDPRVALDH